MKPERVIHRTLDDMISGNMPDQVGFRGYFTGNLLKLIIEIATKTGRASPDGYPLNEEGQAERCRCLRVEVWRENYKESKAIYRIHSRSGSKTLVFQLNTALYPLSVRQVKYIGGAKEIGEITWGCEEDLEILRQAPPGLF